VTDDMTVFISKDNEREIDSSHSIDSCLNDGQLCTAHTAAKIDKVMHLAYDFLDQCLPLIKTSSSVIYCL